MTNPPPPELFPQRPIRSDFGARPYRARRIITIAALVVAIGLGLYLKYSLTPSRPGPIPVIVSSGPLKEKPQQPGGIVIPNQNVMAYQQISGNAKPVTDHLAPPPETPNPATASPAAAPQSPAGSQAPASKVETLEPPPLPQLATTAQRDKAPVLAPPQPADQSASAPAAAQAAAATLAAPAPVSAVETSPVPAPSVMVTPSSPVTQPMPNAAPAATNPPAGQINPVEIKPPEVNKPQTVAPPEKAVRKTVAESRSNYRIQLASMPDESGARTAIKKFERKYSRELGKARLHLAKADLGARGIYYRVQSSGISKSEAQHMCAEIKRHGAGCIIVRP